MLIAYVRFAQYPQSKHHEQDDAVPNVQDRKKDKPATRRGKIIHPGQDAAERVQQYCEEQHEGFFEV